MLYPLSYGRMESANYLVYRPFPIFTPLVRVLVADANHALFAMRLLTVANAVCPAVRCPAAGHAETVFGLKRLSCGLAHEMRNGATVRASAGLHTGRPARFPVNPTATIPRASDRIDRMPATSIHSAQECWNVSSPCSHGWCSMVSFRL